MKFKQTVLAGSIMLATTLTPMIDAQAESKKFKDVPHGHWSYNAITDLANKNIIAGYGNGIFGFGDNITRGQVARMIYAYLKPADDTNIKNPFTDVKGHMFEKEILSLSKIGIMSGYGDGKFGPDNSLTREQLAAVLTRAFNLKATSTSTFKDVDKNYWATNAISALQENKIAAGTGNNMFEPKKVVTREQYAQFLYNAINAKNTSIIEAEKPEKDNSGGSTNKKDIALLVLEQVEIEKQTYQAGEFVHVRVVARGDVPDDATMSIVIKGPGGEIIERAYYYPEAKGWVASIPLGSYAQSGEYIVSDVMIFDNANRAVKYVGGKAFNLNFKVENDQQPLVLNKVEMDKQTYQVGESVKVRVNAKKDVMSALIGIKGHGVEIRERAFYDSQTNEWYANIPLDLNDPTGEYIVSDVALFDNAGNVVEYVAGKDFNLKFNVTSNGSTTEAEKPEKDIAPPVLGKVEIEKQTYQVGENVQVSVPDAYGVTSMFIGISGPDGIEMKEYAYYRPQTKKWVANIRLSANDPSGEYKVSEVTVFDSAYPTVKYEDGKDFNVKFNVITS